MMNPPKVRSYGENPSLNGPTDNSVEVANAQGGLTPKQRLTAPNKNGDQNPMSYGSSASSLISNTNKLRAAKEATRNKAANLLAAIQETIYSPNL